MTEDNHYIQWGRRAFLMHGTLVEGSGVENNGYSVMDIAPDGTIRLTGFRKQKKYEWGKQR